MTQFTATPTPWKIIEGYTYKDLFAIDTVADSQPYVADQLEKKDAERIIECVHAFEGVPNPTEFMEVLREYNLNDIPDIIKHYKKMQDALKHIVADSTEHPYIQKLAEEALKRNICHE